MTAPANTSSQSLTTTRPVRGRGIAAALAVLGVSWGVAVATAATVSTVRPGTDGSVAALVAIGVETVGATALVAWLHRRGATWADLGLTGPGQWQSRRLLALLGALTVLPLAAGVRSPGPSTTVVVLVVGYALTGFTEEILWRGAVLRWLLPLGRSRAVLLGSLLFGLAHLTNVAFRGHPGIVVAQAFGAACFGVGYAAVRLRTHALPALMVCHGLTDLLPHAGHLPAIPVFVAQDVVLLSLGILLLRRTRPVDRFAEDPR